MMKIRAYVRLQACSTNDRLAFVGRLRESHGIAAGPVYYYAVEAGTWMGIRRVLRSFRVMGYSTCNPRSAMAFVKDLGPALYRLWRLQPSEVPAAAQFMAHNTMATCPELTGFGPGATVIEHPDTQLLGVLEPAGGVQ